MPFSILPISLLDIAHLENAYLDKAHLEKASLVQAHLEKASLRTAHLEGALLDSVHLEGANLDSVHLEGANLEKAKLVGAYLKEAHLEGANLEKAKLARAYLKAAFFDSATKLDEISLNNNEYDTAFLCDIHWGDVNVAVVDWSTISILGEENEAREDKSRVRYERAVRAYRQLSVVLRNQGLSEHAARFAFRAQRMQRKVFWYQRKFGQFLFSGFLNLLAGYGYRFWRSFIAYLLVIFIFAITYFIIGHTVWPVLSPLGSFVFSVTSFHGRGFFPGGIALDDPLTVVAALEAFIGLLIEVTFIATLTQRLFGR